MKKMLEMKGTFPIPPGEHIQDWLDAEGMPVQEFCARMGISRATYYRILAGDPIHADTIRKLALVTGASAAFWSNLEANYRQEVLRMKAEEEAVKKKEWIGKQPLRDLVSAGFLPDDFSRRTLGEQMALLCGFYNVSSVDAYGDIHTPYLFAARAVKGVESNSTALTAWLQMAERIAQRNAADLPEYSEKMFRKALGEVRRETVNIEKEGHSFKDFLLWAKGVLAHAGVQTVYLKKVKGVKNLHGVAFWLKNRPVIVLTLHSCAMDRIVFSLYHEAAHILDGKRDLYYVTDKENSDIEIEADRVAAELLIAPSFNRDIERSGGSLETLSAIAEKAGVSAGLVVGRFQKLCNRFIPIRGYTMPTVTWEEIGSWELA